MRALHRFDGFPAFGTASYRSSRESAAWWPKDEFLMLPVVTVFIPQVFCCVQEIQKDKFFWAMQLHVYRGLKTACWLSQTSTVRTHFMQKLRHTEAPQAPLAAAAKPQEAAAAEPAEDAEPEELDDEEIARLGSLLCEWARLSAAKRYFAPKRSKMVRSAVKWCEYARLLALGGRDMYCHVLSCENIWKYRYIYI